MNLTKTRRPLAGPSAGPSAGLPRSRRARNLAVGLALAALLVGCSSDGPSTTGNTAETTVTAQESQFQVPAEAVQIDYFVAKGPAPLLKETLVDLKAPTKSVTMLVDKITYAGVVCGFSFTGADRPVPPLKFNIKIEPASGPLVDATVDVDWTGDTEKAGSAAIEGWNFLSDAQLNRNGPGWVVQVGAIPVGGGQGKVSPKRALCTVTSSVDMPISVGPVAYWAGFATV